MDVEKLLAWLDSEASRLENRAEEEYDPDLSTGDRLYGMSAAFSRIASVVSATEEGRLTWAEVNAIEWVD